MKNNVKGVVCCDEQIIITWIHNSLSFTSGLVSLSSLFTHFTSLHNLLSTKEQTDTLHDKLSYSGSFSSGRPKTAKRQLTLKWTFSSFPQTPLKINDNVAL